MQTKPNVIISQDLPVIPPVEAHVKHILTIDIQTNGGRSMPSAMLVLML